MNIHTHETEACHPLILVLSRFYYVAVTVMKATIHKVGLEKGKESLLFRIRNYRKGRFVQPSVSVITANIIPKEKHTYTCPVHQPVRMGVQWFFLM